ncbi:hypothetical protein ACFSMW_13580 [Virgibacillus halophilus]|uniref:hypothetical protein n=1 Tax=Tigheibacillus halophilus TaxID=361280 RepID=UPI003634440D
MKRDQNVARKHGLISFLSLTVGIVCFFTVFVTPTQIANVGNLIGDYITFAITCIGLLLSIISLKKKTEKNIIPAISLILSLSLFIFWFIVILLLFTGQMDFAP